MDYLTIVSLIVSTIAALAAVVAILLSLRERSSDMKEDFVLWAIERLREPGIREGRRTIYTLKPEEWEELRTLARSHQDDPRLDSIRQVCLSFDEIGYFVYKVGL